MLPNVGNVTPRANVCSCTLGRDSVNASACDCIQTNEIGVVPPSACNIIVNTSGSTNNTGITTV